ncbi:ABC transporter permease [Desulfallas thermosapovorans]|uniref:ABC-2 type transport system permease protein n=1 Tax=Desulfallas thermosapovorans DSM 6562 TaxID=1121431 RepID=A0A5S4ZR02_9FIRM|nr:ABC transporter permease [Desulfallas thermosapovorans]TYO95342.1 ABC-2 type transport system permease protein [Desulfallas thermosapovorans DSM 6562]
MRNAFKVAKWEFKRNIKNKSFLIGMFLTPVIVLLFMLLGTFVGGSSNTEDNRTIVYVHDSIGIFDTLQETVKIHDLNWEMHVTDISEEEVSKELASSDNTAYIFLDDRAIDEHIIPVYTSDKIDRSFMNQIQVLETPIKAWQMKQIGLSDEELAAISRGIQFKESKPKDLAAGAKTGPGALNRIVPGAFAGILLLSIIISGMYIFQSASQEKKDKVAEIILSSLTPGELMQGKIIGYFMLGMIQAVVFLGFALAIALWKVDIPVIEYLLVPEIILFVFIAILGYLLYSAMFVGVGATMADMTSTSNFQGMIIMLPFLPFVLVGPVIGNPNGLIAQIATYIPFTAPGVLLLRLSVLEEWPWVEIFIALAVLVVSIWIFMILAGKIFKTGILMYGKNATPKEIWKWIRA